MPVLNGKVQLQMLVLQDALTHGFYVGSEIFYLVSLNDHQIVEGTKSHKLCGMIMMHIYKEISISYL
jgi:hypothetical protein